MTVTSTSALTVAVLLAVAAFLLLVMSSLQSPIGSAAATERGARAARGSLGIDTAPEESQSETHAPPPALEKSFAVMRALHVRMSRAAESISTRNAASASTSMAQLLHESESVMQAGLAQMRSMKAGLPTREGATPVRSLVPADMTKAQADYVDDFLLLMEMLDQIRADQEAVSRLQVPPTAEFAVLL